MGFHIGPRVVKATGGSIHRAGNFRVHHYPDQHVTDGLICHLDPGDPRSFRPGNKSDNVWFDLSGNGNDATWGAYNHRNNNGGCFRMGSGTTNHTANVPAGGVTSTITNEVTCEFWYKETGANTAAYRVPMMFTQTNNWDKGFGFYIVSGYIGWFVNDYDGSNAFTDTAENQGQTAASRVFYNAPAANGLWAHYMGTYDGIEAKLYVNGSYVASTDSPTRAQRQAERIDFGTADAFEIGHANGAYHIHNGGNAGLPEIGVIRLYNRALCPTEADQNYNAERVRYRTPAYTDTFVPTCTGQGGKVEVLAVAGGGGGAHGTDNGNGVGGGGAGGLVHNDSFTVVSDSSISVTVGAGGTGGLASDTGPAINGGNTVFGSITAIGGGKGGTAGGGSQIRGASPGGAGGGGGYSSNGTSGQAGTAGQGFAGGDNSTGGLGAGGGGAGGVGVSVTATENVPNGGDGLAFSITGSSVTYAGGGGGGKFNGGSGNAGSGGSGGGAAGGKGTDGSAATANTGGGGGGGGMISGSAGKAGGNGGSGIVIIAYKGPQRGTGGTVDTTSRSGYTLHKFTTVGSDVFIA